MPKTTSPVKSPSKSSSGSLLKKAQGVEPQESSRSSYYVDGEGAEILESIAAMRENGCSYAQIADFLNEEGMVNARGRAFTAGSVTNLYTHHYEQGE